MFQDLVGIAVRISIMYLYALLLMRLSGKSSLGQLTPFDFVITTLIGDLFDDMIWAEVSMSKGLVAFSTLVMWHLLVGFFTYRFISLDKLLSGTKTVVIRSGQYIQAGLRKERTNKEDVNWELHLQGEESPDEIAEAAWEPSGQLSIRKKEENKPAQKNDLSQLMDVLR